MKGTRQKRHLQWVISFAIIVTALLVPATSKAESPSALTGEPRGTITDTIVVFHKDTVYYLPSGRRRDPLRVKPLYPKLNDKLRRPILALRSNLLLPLLNVGVECPVSNRWSVAADICYPWCPREWMNRWTTPQMNCLQGLGGYLEGRYWLGGRHRSCEPSYGKYRLLGHSLALVAAAAYYDLELEGSGQQGEVFAAGIGYTFALPVGKRAGVHLEFDIAVGAVYRVWHPYDVHERGGYLLRSKNGNGEGVVSESGWSVCPIRAGVSLVVPFFTGRSPKKGKTGRR